MTIHTVLGKSEAIVFARNDQGNLVMTEVSGLLAWRATPHQGGRKLHGELYSPDKRAQDWRSLLTQITAYPDKFEWQTVDIPASGVVNGELVENDIDRDIKLSTKSDVGW